MSTLPQLPQAASAPAARLVLTWWNQELNLHRLKHQSAKNVDEKGHTLVARIGVQGDENISSAVISPTGDFIAVSTSAEVKFFQLIRPAKKAEASIKIRRVELEEPLGGARQLQLSSDGKWLALITHSNEVNMIRIVIDTDTRDVRILPKIVSLERQSRAKAKSEKSAATLAALQNYSRLITRIQFSPDSKALAASDLSGFIDSWILEGHEDPTAPEVDEPARIAKTSINQDDEVDDEDEEAEEDSPIVILGQHWIRNPTAALLPKLSSPPNILSFRPSTSPQPSQEPNGNPAVHPTRHNPHPIAHVTPKGPYHLIVLTSQHHLFEFDLLHGKLTDWSKNNPPANLPEKFTFLRDRAMGCSWHVKGGAARIWLYGSTWVQMLDLSKDLPEKNRATEEYSKRKRGGGNELSHKRPRVAPVGLAPETLKVVNGHVTKPKIAKESKFPSELNGNTSVADANGDSDDDVLQSGRLRPREQHEAEAVRDTKKDGSPAFWQTRVYRSILGMVNMGERNECLETAIIERPIQELDLPDRNMPAHELPRELGG
jgi:U3 small nucleolar RNA-associated protein 4